MRPPFAVVASLLFAALTTLLSAQSLVRDPTFTQPAFEASTNDPRVTLTLAAHPEGGVLVCTDAAFIDGRPAATIVKLKSDGSIDPAFVAPAFTDFPRIVHVYPDGRVLVHDGRDSLFRLLPTGARDPSYTALRVSLFGSVRAFALSDGRMLAWGPTFNELGPDARVALLHADGGIDRSFAPIASITDVAQQADGKLIIAGSVGWPGGGRRTMGRLNLDGTVDTTFDIGPPVPGGNSGDDMTVVAALPDGKIFAANYSRAIRLLPNGATDPTFRLDLGYDSIPSSVTRVNASGTFYYLGGLPNADGTAVIKVLRRFGPDGVADPSFIVRGNALDSNFPPSHPVSWDERTFYVPGGVTTERAQRRQFVARVDATGAIDANFAPRFARRARSITGLVRAPDGKYLVSGIFDYVNGVLPSDSWVNFVRLNADGTLDRTFQPPPSITRGGTVYGVQPLLAFADGRVLVQGDDGLWRLNADGTRDTTFPLLGITPLAAYPDGRFLAFESGSRLARFSADGVRDPGFNAAGITGSTALLAPQERVLVEVADGSGRKIIRLLPDGAIDPNYSVSLGVPRSAVTWAALADGGVIACIDVPTPQISTTAVRLQHFDAAGRRTFVADLPGTFRDLATAIHHLAAERSGGSFALGFERFQFAGRMHVSGDEISLAPGPRDFANDDIAPLSRFRRASSGPSLFAPKIFLQPTSRSFVRGSSVTLTVQAYGQHEMAYQWFKDGAPLGAPRIAAGSEFFTLSNLQAADAGEYYVEVSNAAGTTRSATARLTFLTTPVVAHAPPTALAVAAGQPVALTINVTGDNLRYRWLRVGDSGLVLVYDSFGTSDGAPGLHTAILPALTVTESGVYRATVSNPAGSVGSTDVTITVVPDAKPGRLENVSVRTTAGRDDRSLIVGFVVAGSAAARLPVLARGAGPALAAFGIDDFLRDPRLTLRADTAILAENDDWLGDSDVTAAAARLGAFPFTDARSRDAALWQPGLAPGNHTVQLTGADASAGTVLAEIYATAEQERGDARIVNLSSRARVESNAPLTAGFVIVGDTACTVMVRAIGAGLAQFGVNDTLPRAELAMFDSAQREIATSARYPGDEIYTLISGRVGSFPVPGGGETNAALVITLPPGAYTAHVRGRDGAAGAALVEVYEVR